MQDGKDRAAGLLFGLAAGDRIGGPIRMALCLAESLCACNRFDADDVGARYRDWWREGAFDTGPTTGWVLARVASGVSFDQAAGQVDDLAGGLTAGCNPAHRVAPLALCASLLDSELAEAAMVEAHLTHRNPLAGDVAAAVACLCRALVRGSPWPDALRMAAADRLPETRRALEFLPYERLSRGGFAPDVLGAAVYFLETSDSFSTALHRSLAFAGPDNYGPVLVGSIGGARWGRRQIESSLLTHPQGVRQRLEEAALTLGKDW